MALNTFITPTWVTKDTATFYKNNLKLLGRFDRSWDDSFANFPGGAKKGYTVHARIVQRFLVSEGQALEPQAIQNQTVPITINHQYHVDSAWSSAQATLEVEEVQKRYTRPMGEALAAKWNSISGSETYRSIWNSIGTPGSMITDNEVWTDGVALLQNSGVPEEYMGIVSPKQQSKLLSTNFALFNPREKISEMFKKGQFSGEALGVDEWFWDSTLPVHTTGTFTTATPIVSGGGQTGSTLLMAGMGTYAMKAGDVFTIDGVFGVNPLAYTSTGELQQFVLTADLAGTTTGTFSFAPSIITSGPLQTVTAGPAASAAVNWFGATGAVAATMTATNSRQNMLFHKSAFAFVMADLVTPLPGAISKRIASKISGLSMRYAEQWSANNDELATRIDTIGGVAVVLPHFALRAWN